jgi:hypothetical protein
VDAVRETFPEVLVHHHDGNLGVASGRNAAATLALRTLDPSYLLFLDNDTVVTPGFLDALLVPLDRDAGIGQTVPKIMLLKDPRRLDAAGGARVVFWRGDTSSIGHGEIDRGQYDVARKCIAGGCTLVRADVFRQLGGFDPLFDPYGPEDLDFSLRVYQAGYYALYVPGAVIFHDPTQTFEAGVYSETYARHKTRHWFLFMRRHASLMEQLGFIGLGIPFLVLRAMIREGRKGNIGALNGLLGGVLDFWRSPVHREDGARHGREIKRLHD